MGPHGGRPRPSLQGADTVAPGVGLVQAPPQPWTLVRLGVWASLAMLATGLYPGSPPVMDVALSSRLLAESGGDFEAITLHCPAGVQGWPGPK